MRLALPDDLRTAVVTRPLVTLAAAYVAGVILADRWPLPVWAPGALAAAGALAAVASRSAALAVAGLFTGAAALGALLHTLALSPPRNDLSRLSGARDAVLTARIADCVFHSDWRSRYVVEAHEFLGADGRAHPVAGRAYVELRSGGRRLMPGMMVVFRDARIERPPAPTNWRQVDRRKLAAHRRIHTTVRAERAEALEGVGGWREQFGAAVLGARAWMVRTLERSMPGPNPRDDALLLASMVFGETAVRIDDEMRELFRRTGTIHLLVVSGAQVSIIVLFIMTFTRSRGRLRWWHVVIICPVLAAFSLVVVWEPSIGRALVMCGLWMVAMAAGRRHDLASAIALSVLVLALVDTAVVFHIGAQLTFAATAGVAVFLPGREARQRETGRDFFGVRRAVVYAALGTAGAWLFITPFLMHHFNNFAFLGSVANLVGVPLAGVIVVVGLLAVVLGGVVPAVGAVLCWVAQKAVALIVATNHVCDALPLSFIDHLHLSAAGVVMWILLAAAGVYMLRTGRAQALWRQRRPEFITGLVVAAAVIATALAVWQLWPRPYRIVTLDVGEGQCTIIETRERKVVMVDAGGRGGLSDYELARDVMLPYLVRGGYRRLDALIITHPHTDHFGAARHLARRLPINLVLTNGQEGGQGYQAFLAELHERGVPVRAGQAGTKLRAGGASLRIISPPPEGGQPRFPGGANNRSLVTRATLNSLTALLPGDTEKPAMSWLVRNLPTGSLRADFLQVPHHGRSSSDHPEFLEAVAPTVAVVSRAGDPVERGAHDTCRRIARHVFSTEESGAVMVESRRGKLRVRTYLGAAM